MNPTVIHEAYHTLVFKMKWMEEEASQALKDAMMDQNNLFINQSQKTTLTGLNLATEYHLGGRDALILANFLFGRVPKFLTFDGDLLETKKVKYGRKIMLLNRP